MCYTTQEMYYISIVIVKNQLINSFINIYVITMLILFNILMRTTHEINFNIIFMVIIIKKL